MTCHSNWRRNGGITGSKELVMENLRKPAVIKQEAMNGKLMMHGRRKTRWSKNYMPVQIILVHLTNQKVILVSSVISAIPISRFLIVIPLLKLSIVTAVDGGNGRWKISGLFIPGPM